MKHCTPPFIFHNKFEEYMNKLTKITTLDQARLETYIQRSISLMAYLVKTKTNFFYYDRFFLSKKGDF